MTTTQFMFFFVDEDIALRKLRAAIVLQCNDCTAYALHYVLARPLQDLKLYAQRWLAAEKRHGHPLISGTPICDDVHELLGLPPLPHHTLHASDTVRHQQPPATATGPWDKCAHFFLLSFCIKHK